MIKYSEGWTNRSVAGSIAEGQAHQELVTRSYTVERVIDGNTIKLTNGERVRLIGIDAPESQPNNKAKSDAERTGQDLETINKMGQEATEFVKGLIKEGQEVRLEFDVQGRDKYGRTLAYVRRIYDTPEKIKDFFKMTEATIKTEYLDDGETRHNLYFECTNEPPPEATCKLYVNETIIKAGYATPMTMPPNVRYADLFKELYEEAREQKMGLWRTVGENKQTLWKSYVEEGREKSFPPQISDQYLKNDLDGDGDCDNDDEMIFNKYLGECLGGGNYSDLADADHNSCVTESDRQLLFPCDKVEGE